MKLYLIRHGIATERSPEVDDPQRPLTDHGRQKTRRIAQHLKSLAWRVDCLYTSPLVRAHQTATLLSEAGVCDRLEVLEALAPEGSLTAALGAIAQLYAPSNTPSKAPPTCASVALVGHEPDLSQWAECLLWGPTQGDSTPAPEQPSKLVLKKASILGLQLPNPSLWSPLPLGAAQLFWLSPPRWLLGEVN